MFKKVIEEKLLETFVCISIEKLLTEVVGLPGNNDTLVIETSAQLGDCLIQDF
jgi:hypothetical protein